MAATGNCWRIERPRSPCTARLSHRAYCVGHGSFKPRSCRNLASVSPVAIGPSIASAASPGARWIIMKTTIVAAKRVGTTSANRRATHAMLMTAGLRTVERSPGSALGDLFEVQHVLIQAQRDALDIFPRGGDEVGMEHEDPRRVLGENLLRLLVEFRALRLVGVDARLRQ